MSKKITILIWIFFINAVNSLYSQNDSIPEYQLSEIVILADRLPAVETISIFEITPIEIRKLDVKNAQEALRHVPGLYFSRSTKNEMTFKIRGFEQRQVSVYLDGVPISIPYDGVVDISQFAGDNFESIRIMKGVSSILYGANNLGGTVHIITDLPEKKLSYKWRTEGSLHGEIFTNILLSGSVQKLKYSASMALDRAPEFSLPEGAPIMLNEDGGKRNNSSYRKNSYNFKIQYSLHPSHKIGAHLSFINNRIDVPPNALMTNPRYWKFPEWKKNVLSLNTEHIFSRQVIIRSIWFLDTYRNILESYDDDTYSTQSKKYAFTSIYDDYTTGGIIYPQVNWSPTHISRGIISYKNDVHREKSNSSAPFDRYSTGMMTTGIEHELNFHEHWKALFGIDGNYLQPLNAEDVSPRNPLFLINNRFSVKYFSALNWEFHGSLGRKTRFPTMKELYSERLGRNIPNPDLKYEQSLNLEVGWRWTHSTGFVESIIFQNYLTDHIVNVQVGDGIQQYQNLGKVLSRGWEATLQNKWKSFEFFLSYTFLFARNRTPDRTSPYLEYRPAHQFHGLLYFSLHHAFQMGIEFSYFASQYYQNPDNLRWEKLNDYSVVNGRGELNFTHHFSMYIRVNNLLDTFYYSEYGIPMPGRGFLLGIRING